MRIISWNVNGIRAAHRKGAFDWMRENAPDIFCMQETKAWPEQLDAEILEIPGYHSFLNWPRGRKGYSGVAVYSKTQPVSVTRGLGIEELDTEGRSLALDFGRFVLVNTYFPNGGSGPERLAYKLRYYDAFLTFVNNLRAKGRSLVLCGDFNTAHTELDIARPKENQNVSGFLPVERGWLDSFTADGYVDTFRMFTVEGEHYTWWDMKTRARERNVGWRLDYFFVSSELKQSVRSASILPDVQGSDHCPIELTLY